MKHLDVSSFFKCYCNGCNNSYITWTLAPCLFLIVKKMSSTILMYVKSRPLGQHYCFFVSPSSLLQALTNKFLTVTLDWGLVTLISILLIPVFPAGSLYSTTVSVPVADTIWNFTEFFHTCASLNPKAICEYLFFFCTLLSVIIFWPTEKTVRRKCLSH